MKARVRDLTGKVVSYLAASVLFFVMVFSVYYIAEEHCHECEGEDCPICECIHICEGILYQVDGRACAAIALTVILVIVCADESVYIPKFSYDTLVSEKVRIDN